MNIKNHQPEVHFGFQGGTEPFTLPSSKKPKKIGLYAASFDPVHAGHIIFALKAQKLAGLESIYFLPERRPQRNSEPEHYVHRSIMLKHALKPHRQFSMLDLPDANLTARSLPRIREELPDAELSLLTTASELLWHEGELPKLYGQLHLIVAITSHRQLAEVLERTQGSGQYMRSLTFVDLAKDNVSSSAVRSGLRQNKPVRGLLPSVIRYARTQWLYISPHKG